VKITQHFVYYLLVFGEHAVQSLKLKATPTPDGAIQVTNSLKSWKFEKTTKGVIFQSVRLTNQMVVQV